MRPIIGIEVQRPVDICEIGWGGTTSTRVNIANPNGITRCVNFPKFFSVGAIISREVERIVELGQIVGMAFGSNIGN